MASQLKSFSTSPKPASLEVASWARHSNCQPATLASWLPIALTFAAIMAAEWSPDGIVKLLSVWLVAISVVGFTFAGRYTVDELARPNPADAGRILATGAWLVMVVAALAAFTPHLDPPRSLPMRGLWVYAIWALLQQFLLQSFFYVRLEALTERRWAVPVCAALFAAAHAPNPILTPATFVGALFFTGLFRRYRTIYPLAAVHAALGVTIAATFSDHLLRHMRVGLGYLTFHP